MRIVGLVAFGVVVLGAVGCLGDTEGYCRQAVEERSRNEPGRAFPEEEFLRACRRLPAAHAHCTVPSYAGSYAVLSEKGCHEAYANPDFPRDLLLGAPSQP